MMRAERVYSVKNPGAQQYRRGESSHMRRVRQLRRRMITAAFTVCLSFMIGLLGFSFLSRAQAEENAVAYKYFTSIQVQQGDTLYSIAQKYSDRHYKSVYAYMEEVCRTNHLLDEDICAGDYLVVPYYSTEFR